MIIIFEKIALLNPVIIPVMQIIIGIRLDEFIFFELFFELFLVLDINKNLIANMLIKIKDIYLTDKKER